MVFIKMHHTLSVPGALMDAPPEPLAHYWTSSRTLERLPEDHLPTYEQAPPADMYLVRPLNLHSAKFLWGFGIFGGALVGIIAGFILGTLLEFGRC